MRAAKSKTRSTREEQGAPDLARKGRNAAASRASILEHAIAEFASEGVAGARTANIAKTAGVNKALLYYYFKDKDSLYSAALHSVFSGMVEEMQPILASAITPGEKVLRLARLHFEYLITHPNYPRLIHQELSRARSHGAPSKDFQEIGTSHFLPLQRAGRRALEEGIASGEFRKVESSTVLSTMLGMNVFYFVSAPIMRMVRGIEPFSPEGIRGHIQVSLDIIGSALFSDREYGIKLAKRIAAEPSALRRKSAREKAKKPAQCPAGMESAGTGMATDGRKSSKS